MRLAVLCSEGNTVLALYAVDKMKQEDQNYPKNKLPVRKFKIRIALNKLMAHIKRFDVTLTNNGYNLEDMLVMNK
ncbi:hypothetical protein BH11BAC1_BH11BAC1_02910 [soil metagenome]